MSVKARLWVLATVATLAARPALGRDAGDPIRLAWVEARIGETLETLRGRSIIRNAKAVATVDVTIDVAGGRITGFSGLGAKRQTYDEHVDLPAGTYWGPLIFIVIKNFEANAIDPIIRLSAPATNLFAQPGVPPALVRFEGPRNFAGQKIRIE